MQKLKLDTIGLRKGLLTICFGTLCGLGLMAQAPGIVKDATKTAKEPFKEVQGVIKEGTQPIKDVNRTIKDIEKAPKDVTNEVKRTGQEFEKAEREVEKTEREVEKVTGSGNGKNKEDDKKAEGDAKKTTEGDGKTSQTEQSGNTGQTSTSKSTEAGNTGSGTESNTEQATHKSAIPPDYVPQPKTQEAAQKGTEPEKKGELPFYSRDNKTPSGPWPKSELSNKAVASGGTEVAADGKTDNNKVVEKEPVVTKEPEEKVVEPQIGVSDGNAEGAERFVNLDPEVAKPREKRPKPDYSGSPARIALEKAEFELETLEDLFQYSNWEGPEREHTVRAVGYALDDLQNAISEIKRLDPAHPTYRFENRYKEMRAAYVNEVRSQQ